MSQILTLRTKKDGSAKGVAIKKTNSTKKTTSYLTSQLKKEGDWWCCLISNQRYVFCTRKAS